LQGAHGLYLRANATFADMFNSYVEFRNDRRALHTERGSVVDFDSQYHAQLNIR